MSTLKRLPKITDELLLKNDAWLRHLSRQLVGEESLAEDLAQETWLRFLRRAPGENLGVRSLLYSTLRGIAASWNRSQRRRVIRERIASRTDQSPETSPEETANLLALKRTVIGAILELQEPYKTLVILHYYHKMKPVEIARSREIPAGTVRSQLSRALVQLRKDLRTKLGHEDDWRMVLAPLTAGTARWSPTVVVTSALMLGLLATALLWATSDPRSSDEPGYSVALKEEQVPAADHDEEGGREPDPTIHRGSGGENPAVPPSTEPDGPRRSFRVQVLDHEGRPAAGIFLDLQLQRSLLWRGRTLRQIACGETKGKEGIAELELFPGILELLRTGEKAYLHSHVHLYPPKIIPVDPFRLPGETVRFTLPALGVVRVRLLDALGSPMPIVRANLRLAEQPEEPPLVMSTLTDRAQVMGWKVLKPEGMEAIFPDVGLGLSLEARVQYAGGNQDFYTGVGTGPRSAGEEVRLDVVHPGLLLHGTLLKEDRTPLAAESLEASFVQALAWGNREMRYSFTTDERGCFHIGIHPCARNLMPSRAWLHIKSRISEEETAGLGVKIDLPERMPHEVLDLGKIQLKSSGVEQTSQAEQTQPEQQPEHKRDAVNLELRLLLPDRTPIWAGEVHLISPNGDAPPLRAVMRQRGVIEISAPEGRREFVIVSRALQSVRVFCRSEKQDVIVRRSIVLDVHCRGIDASLRSKAAVWVKLERKSDCWDVDDRGEAHRGVVRMRQLDAKGQATFRLPEEGEYGLSIVLWRKRLKEPGCSPLIPVEGTTQIVVTADSKPRTVEYHLDREACLKILAAE